MTVVTPLMVQLAHDQAKSIEPTNGTLQRLEFAKALEVSIAQKIADRSKTPFCWIRDSGIEKLRLINGGSATVYAREAMSSYPTTPLYTEPPTDQHLVRTLLAALEEAHSVLDQVGADLTASKIKNLLIEYKEQHGLI